MSKELRDNLIYVFRIVVPFSLIAIIIYFAVRISQPPLEFKPFTPDDVSRLISSLLIVTVFLERTLEIFVTAIREPRAKELEREVTGWKLYVEKYTLHSPGQKPEYALEDAQKYQRLAETNRDNWKAGTQRFALWTGLVIGLLVSGVGVRSLEVFVDTAKLSAAFPNQLLFFRIVDILITGGLLAGGSDGIHKIARTLDAFWERGQQNLKRSPGEGTPNPVVSPELPPAPPPPVG